MGNEVVGGARTGTAWFPRLAGRRARLPPDANDGEDTLMQILTPTPAAPVRLRGDDADGLAQCAVQEIEVRVRTEPCREHRDDPPFAHGARVWRAQRSVLSLQPCPVPCELPRGMKAGGETTNLVSVSN